jgi:hypothetical protein
MTTDVVEVGVVEVVESDAVEAVVVGLDPACDAGPLPHDVALTSATARSATQRRRRAQSWPERVRLLRRGIIVSFWAITPVCTPARLATMTRCPPFTPHPVMRKTLIR